MQLTTGVVTSQDPGPYPDEQPGQRLTALHRREDS
jgi:hypothetical protein